MATTKLYNFDDHPEHKQALEDIKQKYIDNSMRTDAMTKEDRDMMYVAMRGLYKNAEVAYPGDDRIIFVRSPLEAQFACGIATAAVHGELKYDGALSLDDIEDEGIAEAILRTESAMNVAAKREVNNRKTGRDAKKKKLELADDANSLERYLKHFIRETRIYGKAALQHTAEAWKFRTRSALWPWYQVYGDFFKNVAKLPGEWEKWDPLNLDALHGGVRFMTPEFTIISDRPEILKVDEQNRLHNEFGPATKWRDGLEQYYWHGQAVPDVWLRDKKHLTPKLALTQTNVEQRRAACEILGWANVLEDPSLNPKIIDKDEPHIGTLIEVDLPDAPKQWFLKYQCGTGRWFAESVNDKKFNTALKANAGGNGYRGNGDPMKYIPFART